MSYASGEACTQYSKIPLTFTRRGRKSQHPTKGKCGASRCILRFLLASAPVLGVLYCTRLRFRTACAPLLIFSHPIWIQCFIFGQSRKSTRLRVPGCLHLIPVSVAWNLIVQFTSRLYIPQFKASLTSLVSHFHHGQVRRASVRFYSLLVCLYCSFLSDTAGTRSGQPTFHACGSVGGHAM
jgi:hypothetical protein